jgi:DNA-binding transcriptional LysR family regulator
MIQAGLGIGVLPEAAARTFASPMGLRLISLTDAWARRRMFVAVRQLETLAAPARLLVEHLAQAKP